MIIEVVLMVGVVFLIQRHVAGIFVEEFEMTMNTSAFWVNFLFAVGAMILALFTEQNYPFETVGLWTVFVLDGLGVFIGGVRSYLHGGL